MTSSAAPDRSSGAPGAEDPRPPRPGAPPLIFERSRPGRRCAVPPRLDVPAVRPEDCIPAHLLRRTPPRLPEVGELDLVRHYTALSMRNLGIDTTFYPLGSCTMKYNPKRNETAARIAAFRRLHPYAPDPQGALMLLAGLERFLVEISGLAAVSLQPAAGAHGELTGLMIARAWFRDRGETERTEVLVPDSAHGTNPASCTLCRLSPRTVRSGPSGDVDLEDLRAKLGPRTAVFMMTNPNTLGLFDRNIIEIAQAVHEAGALLYLDGANLNAIVGITRPGDFGVDIMHFNLHKTFSTPHGGGGPGAGPVGVAAPLVPFLPVPRIREEDGRLRLDDDYPKSIGKVRAFWGSFGVLLRAYAYLRSLGPEELRAVAEHAVLNANYVLARLRPHYDLPYDRRCMHEFVLSAERQKKLGVSANDIAKRLLDYGFHPPTVYFPLIVREALMIEPTETEGREVLDAFVEAMVAIGHEAERAPGLVTGAPYACPVRRVEQLAANRKPVVRWLPGGAS